MKYTVLWQAQAEETLAKLWTESPDKQAIADAADSLDLWLAKNPRDLGESRDGNERVCFPYPIAALFSISESDMTVFVLKIWRISPPK